MPFPVVARSKALVYSCWLSGIAYSNLADDMDARLVPCFVGWKWSAVWWGGPGPLGAVAPWWDLFLRFCAKHFMYFCCPMHVTCSAHLTVRDVITLIMFGDEYKILAARHAFFTFLLWILRLIPKHSSRHPRLEHISVCVNPILCNTKFCMREKNGNWHIREYSQWYQMQEVLLGKFCDYRYLSIFCETKSRKYAR
jgi:hypothetical protein